MRVFVSYAGPDRPWAVWAAATLRDAGHAVELDVWDWSAGDNAPARMSHALELADVVLALWSDAYFAPDRFTHDEWTAVLADRPHERKRIVPVRVAEVTPPRLLRSLIYRDVFDVDSATARDALLDAVEGSKPPGPGAPAVFPGHGRPSGAIDQPRVPGSVPAVWNIPARNRAFTGRHRLLADLHERVNAGDHRALVQALNGIGGVGKSQLAIEYTHLFSGEYDLAWWIDAENPLLIGEQLAQCAVTAGRVAPGASIDTAWSALRDALRRTDRWVLVFDNASGPRAVEPWLPQGPGHVIITSRSAAFSEIASPVEVREFRRDETRELLGLHRPDITGADADRLARALGDLPLAVAQAASLLSETGLSVGEFLDELDDHCTEILQEGLPVNYPLPLAAGVVLATRMVAGTDGALELTRVLAVLAPEPVPVAWFIRDRGSLAGESATAELRPLSVRRVLTALARHGLVRVTPDTVQMHRLTQAILRDQRSSAEVDRDRGHAAALLAAVEPTDDGTDPGSWADWAPILTHLLALDLAAESSRVRPTACNALFYLLSRGEFPAAAHLAGRWYPEWGAVLGPDHPDVLAVATHLAQAFRMLGRRQDALELLADVLPRHRRVLGPDHPSVLSTANNLAVCLRYSGVDGRAALDLLSDTHARRARVLGENHPHTLNTANHLAAGLRQLGRHAEALDLDLDTLARSRSVLGEDNLLTLGTASNLAISLSKLGRFQEACAVDTDTFHRRRRVLGEDHPDTLTSAQNLAVTLRQCGRSQEACDVGQETLRRRQARFGHRHPATLESARNLLNHFRAAGRLVDAEALERDLATWNEAPQDR